MAKLTRVLLKGDPKGKRVLATVDGPINRYMLSLQRHPESALVSISEDFSSDVSPLYGKGESKGFNANRCRFMSVVINAYFYVEAYQSLLPPDLEEYQLMQEIIDAFEFLWFYPMRSFTNTQGIQSVYSNMIKWVSMAEKQGDHEQSIHVLQATFVLLYVGRLNMASISPLLQKLIPAEVANTTKHLEEIIKHKYLEIVNGKKEEVIPAADIISAHQQYVDGFKQKFSAIKSHQQKLEIAFQEDKAHLEKTIEVLKSIETPEQDFWSHFSDYASFKKYISKLGLKLTEEKAWRYSFKYFNKDRLKFKKSHWLSGIFTSHITTEEILSKINQNIIHLLESHLFNNYFDQNTVKLSQELASTLNKIESEFKIEEFDSAYQTYFDYLSNIQLQNWTIHLPEDIFGMFFESLASNSSASFIKQTYLAKKSKKTLLQIDTRMDKFHSDFKVLCQAFAKFIFITRDIFTEDEIHELENDFEQYVKYIILNNSELLSLKDKIKSDSHVIFLLERIKVVKLEIKDFLDLLNKIIIDRNEMTAGKVYTETKVQLESTHHSGFWAWLFTYLSPSYNHCLEVCQQFIACFLSLSIKQQVESSQSLQQRLTKALTSRKWWEVDYSHSEQLTAAINQHQFFASPAPVVIQEQDGEEVFYTPPSSPMPSVAL